MSLRILHQGRFDIARTHHDVGCNIYMRRPDDTGGSIQRNACQVNSRTIAILASEKWRSKASGHG
jgi:hypothetical protein